MPTAPSAAARRGAAVLQRVDRIDCGRAARRRCESRAARDRATAHGAATTERPDSARDRPAAACRRAYDVTSICVMLAHAANGTVPSAAAATPLRTTPSEHGAVGRRLRGDVPDAERRRRAWRYTICAGTVEPGLPAAARRRRRKDEPGKPASVQAALPVEVSTTVDPMHVAVGRRVGELRSRARRAQGPGAAAAAGAAAAVPEPSASAAAHAMTSKRETAGLMPVSTCDRAAASRFGTLRPMPPRGELEWRGARGVSIRRSPE